MTRHRRFFGGCAGRRGLLPIARTSHRLADHHARSVEHARAERSSRSRTLCGRRRRAAAPRHGRRPRHLLRWRARSSIRAVRRAAASPPRGAADLKVAIKTGQPLARWSGGPAARPPSSTSSRCRARSDFVVHRCRRDRTDAARALQCLPSRRTVVRGPVTAPRRVVGPICESTDRLRARSPCCRRSPWATSGRARRRRLQRRHGPRLLAARFRRRSSSMATGGA